MTPALKTHDLAVGYGRQSVLSHINLAVAPGELVCLLGVNGIGKSTLMRTLAWMQPALGGSVEIDGRDISRMNQGELARKVAVVLTERVAIGAMPAYGLVALGRYPHTGWAGQLSDADRDIVAEAIAAVGAQHLAQRDINELSDGERQRILIARALAQRPAVLLLDEPSAFLDVSARVEIMAMLRRLAREQQVAVVLSSHDLELSLRTADTLWLVDRAGAMHVGAPEDLLADGSVAGVFSGPEVVFSTLERSFKIRGHGAVQAFVTGPGERADLARSVLEREGFLVVAAEEGVELRIAVAASGWEGSGAHGVGRGSSFAELALFARRQARGSHDV
jgi:iron complex transport system ATP-binding protein